MRIDVLLQVENGDLTMVEWVFLASHENLSVHQLDQVPFTVTVPVKVYHGPATDY
jgi:hypothetical protein